MATSPERRVRHPVWVQGQNHFHRSVRGDHHPNVLINIREQQRRMDKHQAAVRAIKTSRPPTARRFELRTKKPRERPRTARSAMDLASLRKALKQRHISCEMIFRLMDVDRSDHISFKEFSQGIAASGVRPVPSGTEMMEIFDLIGAPCSLCSAPAVRKCEKCRKAAYCSRRCQGKALESHSASCERQAALAKSKAAKIRAAAVPATGHLLTYADVCTSLQCGTASRIGLGSPTSPPASPAWR